MTAVVAQLVNVKIYYNDETDTADYQYEVTSTEDPSVNGWYTFSQPIGSSSPADAIQADGETNNLDLR
jgi:hypothetical protein